MKIILNLDPQMISFVLHMAKLGRHSSVEDYLTATLNMALLFDMHAESNAVEPAAAEHGCDLDDGIPF